jgi:uncharacterized protein DUF4259
MGAWGIGPFENDDACDWIIDVDVLGERSELRELFADSEHAAAWRAELAQLLAPLNIARGAATT